uniref:Uncharacterized protein n=1 Tax=Pristionchus pacificus TaxID=54126 RepID=A0A2A6BFD0_PRIPA|eukprot:PDM64511.1 hypothetical protein PRIPAC_52767 [Pristionchus pacificus]
MDPSESLDWYSGLHIVEEGEDAAAAAAAARAAEKQPEESISSVIGSAFTIITTANRSLPISPILATSFNQDHAHHHQSVIVQSTTVTSSGSAGYGSSHFPSSSFMPPSTSTASNLFLPHSFMGLSFPEFETSQLPYPVLHSSHQHPSLDLFDPHHWMGVLDGKKEGGNTRRPSFTEAIFPQVFGTAAGQGILDFGSCAAAAAATATASQHQQQQNHAALKHDPLDALYLSPSLPSTLSSPFLIPSSLQAPPTPKGLLVGGGGGVGTVSSGYGTSTVIREAVLDMEKPEDREMMEQECQSRMQSNTNARAANDVRIAPMTSEETGGRFHQMNTFLEEISMHGLSKDLSGVSTAEMFADWNAAGESLESSMRVSSNQHQRSRKSLHFTLSLVDRAGETVWEMKRPVFLTRCAEVSDVQNKRFRKEDIPMGGTMISDLVGKGQGKGTDIDSLLKINFNQSFGTMGQMQLQQQQPHLHQSTPQSFYC